MGDRKYFRIRSDGGFKSSKNENSDVKQKFKPTRHQMAYKFTRKSAKRCYAR